jgi:hypothetical protein
MSSFGSVGLSLTLTIAVGIAPVAADWCVSSCTAMHGSISGHAGARSAPACHHSSSPLAGAGRAPAPCGHDHRARPSVTSIDTWSVRSALASFVALPAVPAAPAISVAEAQHASPDSSPPPDLFPLALSSSLRI